jgi:hypothetical protein
MHAACIAEFYAAWPVDDAIIMSMACPFAVTLCHINESRSYFFDCNAACRAVHKDARAAAWFPRDYHATNGTFYRAIELAAACLAARDAVAS